MIPPAKFYKYMNASTAKRVLENNTLRWSLTTEFNDPFDLQFDLHMEFNRDRLVRRVLQRIVDIYMGQAHVVAGNQFDERIELFRTLAPGLPEIELRDENRQAVRESLKAAEHGLPKLHEELRKLILDKKILCLSEMPDNILMWGHYAENHTGAVIEVSYIEEGDYASTWGAAKPVRYEANIPLLADEEAMFCSLTGQGTIAVPNHFQDTVYVKAQDWAYEKEWRVIGSWEKDTKTEDIPFRLKELTAVYLGCRMSVADREQIKETIAKKYPHAAVHKVNKSARRFALEFAK
jgi:hypothetical protein